MGIFQDHLDFQLGPPYRLYQFADQDFLTRWRIEAWESNHLKYGPTPEGLAFLRAEEERAKTRAAQMAARLVRAAALAKSRVNP